MNSRSARRLAQTGIAALLAACALSHAPAARAQHDSNTGHRIGKAIQYPFQKGGKNVSKSTRRGAKDVQYGTRKSASNLSIDAHRATGHNSVERRRNGSRRHNTVVTPKGHLHRLHGSR